MNPLLCPSHWQLFIVTLWVSGILACLWDLLPISLISTQPLQFSTSVPYSSKPSIIVGLGAILHLLTPSLTLTYYTVIPLSLFPIMLWNHWGKQLHFIRLYLPIPQQSTWHSIRFNKCLLKERMKGKSVLEKKKKQALERHLQGAPQKNTLTYFLFQTALLRDNSHAL